MAKVRKQFNLSEAENRYLQQTARRDGVTETEIVRSSIAKFRILDEMWNTLPAELRIALARSPFRQES